MSEQQTHKRRRGGQPGNCNALKHGRYLSRNRPHPLPTTEEDQITILDQLIFSIKRQMDKVAEEGKRSTDPASFQKTLNYLTQAAFGLCRMLRLYVRLTDEADQFDRFIAALQESQNGTH